MVLGIKDFHGNAAKCYLFDDGAESWNDNWAVWSEMRIMLGLLIG
jgi:hypothetical protein